MKNTKAIIIVFSLIFLAGCVTVVDMRLAESSKDEWAVIDNRSVSRNGDLLRLTSINGRPTRVRSRRFPAPEILAVTVSPEMHAITFDFVRSSLFRQTLGADGTLKFTAKHGRTYTLDSEDVDGAVRIWVKDVTSGESVSESAFVVLAPRPEPVESFYLLRDHYL